MVEECTELAGLGLDVLSLLDQIDQVVAEAKRIPFSAKIMIDEDVLSPLLEDLRARLPEELREAKWLLMERDRIISEAKSQANRTVEDARSKVSSLTDETVIIKEAQSQAQELLEKARLAAREIRYGALEYADKVLGDADRSLEKSLEQVRAGRSELKITR